MSWAKQRANPYHHSLKQPFGREGTDQCDKLWLWKQHAMLHKVMQMQGFRWGGIYYQYVNVYSFHYFVIFVSLIITFAWGIPTFTVFWKNVCFDPCISVEKSCICRPIFLKIWQNVKFWFNFFNFCSILGQWTFKTLWIFLPGYPFHDIVLWFHIFHIRTRHLTRCEEPPWIKI